MFLKHNTVNKFWKLIICIILHNFLHFISALEVVASNSKGWTAFLEAASDVMFLKSAKRTLPSQLQLQRKLKGVRGNEDDKLLESNIKFICNYHLHHLHFDEAFKQEHYICLLTKKRWSNIIKQGYCCFTQQEILSPKLNQAQE